MKWPLKTEARLIELWRQGQTNVEIRETFKREGFGDVTERAISAKGRRLGLGRRGPATTTTIKQRPMASGTSKGCQWIKKEDPPFLNAPRCGKRTIPGRSWCPECARRVYAG